VAAFGYLVIAIVAVLRVRGDDAPSATATEATGRLRAAARPRATMTREPERAETITALEERGA
jgi:hypothetical protein